MMDIPRFVFPWALCLLVLVPWTIWLGARIRSLSTGRKWTAVFLRVVILICLIGAVAGTELERITDDLAVYFLLDQSDSIPEESRMASAQAVRNVSEQFMTAKDKAGVIVFGREASIELGVDSTLGMGDILSYVETDQTDLASAIRLAIAAFPQGHMKRIVVYSDGNETRGTVLEEAKLARAAGISIDVVPLRSDNPQEVRVRDVSVPGQANADEPFQLRIVVYAEQDSEATLRVFQRLGAQTRQLTPQDVTLQAGDNTFVLTQELQSPGFYEYEVVVESLSDTVLANNRGRAFTVVQGEPRILYVEGDAEHGLYLEPALRSEGLNVVKVHPGMLPASLAQLQNYDAVVLADVSATDLTLDQMKSIEAMVRDLGIGLVAVGGPSSFGAGGYLDTPVENALPVDMDIKQRKMMPRGALALIMHTCEFRDGNAWARDIALASLNVLSSQDLMGMLGYVHGGQGLISGDSWIFDLGPVRDKSAMRQLISEGSTRIGDMPSVVPTLKMAYTALKGADAAVKRIMLISDGDPAGPSPVLLQQLKNAGISVSTVCINPHSMSDQNMLRNLSTITGGQYYFVTNPNKLPQIFMKEAAVVKRGLLIEKPFQPKPNHDSELLFGLGDTPMPDLQGYVVTTAKDNATVPLLSHEDDPVLAHWRYGLGKSVAFTSDATNRWAVDWLNWPGFNRFWAQTVRWATRELSPSNFRVETAVRDGMGHIKIDAVDEDGNFINFLSPRGVVTGPAPDFKRREIELPPTGPGIYEATFPLDDSGVYMMNLLYEKGDGTQGTIPAGLALGYSPEYEYTTTNIPLLEQVADVGAGQIRTGDSNPYEHDLVAAPSVKPIWHLLALVAACLFPLEIFVRRVVVPFAVIYDPIVRFLRRLPALGRLIPMPALRPAPVTGTYSAAPAATEREYLAGRDEATTESFASSVRPPAAAAAEPGESEGTGEAQQVPEKPKSEYTSQLLAAKDRAIARKTRRTRSDNDENE